MMIQSIQFMSCQMPLNLFHARSDRRFNCVIQFMCKVWTHFLPTFCQCTCVAWQLSPRKSIGRNSRFHSCQGTGRRQSNCGLGGNHVGTKFICHGIPGSQPMSRASKLRALPFKRGLSLGGVFQGQMYGPDLPFPRTERSWRFPNIPWPRAVRKARERLQRHHVVATRQIPVAQNCCPWHGTPRPMLQRFKATRPNHNKKAATGSAFQSASRHGSQDFTFGTGPGCRARGQRWFVFCPASTLRQHDVCRWSGPHQFWWCCQ